jgi:hypothetical protein
MPQTLTKPYNKLMQKRKCQAETFVQVERQQDETEECYKIKNDPNDNFIDSNGEN